MRRFHLVAALMLASTYAYGQHANGNSTKDVAICIEYFGDVDKPIDPIVISEDQEGGERGRTEALSNTGLHFAQVFIVRSTVFTQMLSAVRAFPSTINPKPDYFSDFNVVILQGHNRSVTSLSKKQTYLLIDRFKEYCRRGKLFDVLVAVQERIR